jgi:DNA sulfur modification protein DndD
MVFQFQEIRMRNWLVYKDETIPLSNTQNGQNLVVFHGQNGYGKTSLLKALQFLFHSNFNRDEAYKHWNDRAKEQEMGELSVGLKFTHNGRVCQLTRKVDFEPWGNTYKYAPSVELIINGDSQEGQIQDVISQIIPKESQQFVFFDGAEITRYAEQQHEEGVKDAIEQILGIPAVRNLRDDLEKIIGDLEAEQADIVMKSDQKTDLIRRKQETEDALEVYKEKKTLFQTKKDSIRKMLNQLQNEAVQVQALESDSKLLSEKEARIADYTDQQADIDEQLQALMEDAPLYMLAYPLTQIVAEADAKAEVAAKRSISGERKRIIQEILDEEVCICGTETNGEMIDTLTNLLQRLGATTGNGEQANGLSRSDANTLSRIADRIKNNPANGEQLVKQKAILAQKILELETDIADLSEKLKGHKNANISGLYRQREAMEIQLDNVTNELATYQAQLEEAQKVAAEIQRELDQLMASDSQGQGIMQTLNKTRALHSAVSEYVEQLIQIKQKEIRELTSEIFLAITNKPEEYAGIIVKDDYTLQVYRHDESVVENEQLSAGEKEVLAYSFITALNLSSANPAPFVMDTPFGHLDSGHRSGLLDSLPKLGVQVFLLATDRDLPVEERDRIQNHVAQEFLLERNQREALTTIREVNS